MWNKNQLAIRQLDAREEGIINEFLLHLLSIIAALSATFAERTRFEASKRGLTHKLGEFRPLCSKFASEREKEAGNSDLYACGYGVTRVESLARRIGREIEGNRGELEK